MLRPRDTMVHRPTMNGRGDTMVPRSGRSDTMVRHVEAPSAAGPFFGKATTCSISSISTTSRMKCGLWWKANGPSWRTSCRRQSPSSSGRAICRSRPCTPQSPFHAFLLWHHSSRVLPPFSDSKSNASGDRALHRKGQTRRPGGAACRLVAVPSQSPSHWKTPKCALAPISNVQH
jgi:hypothetical protein